jgi:4a-hydroxytetrahydrobiopterin dehydratase
MMFDPEQRCRPCETGDPISRNEALDLLRGLDPEWRVNDAGDAIERTIEFGNYYQTIAFVNAVAWIAHTIGHHPQLEVDYGHCLIRYSTHSINGLSESDFICAARIDALLDGSDGDWHEAAAPGSN